MFKELKSPVAYDTALCIFPFSKRLNEHHLQLHESFCINSTDQGLLLVCSVLI